MYQYSTDSHQACPAFIYQERGGVFDPAKIPILTKILNWIFYKLIACLSPTLKKIPASPRSVVIVTGGNLGGAVLSLPLIKSIKSRFPNAHLCVISNTKIGCELMRFVNAGDSYHMVHSLSFRKVKYFLSFLKVYRAIKMNKPEILILNFNCSIEKFLLFLRIPIRIGHVGVTINNQIIREKAAINYPVPISSNMNWLETYQLLANRLNIDFISSPSIQVFPEVKKLGREILQKFTLQENEYLLAIQIGVWEQQMWKQWPIDQLIKTCQILWKTYKLRPVFLGAASGLGLVDRIVQKMSDAPSINLVNQTDIKKAVAVLSQCHLSICNDSGLMHLSAAVGVPTVGVYGMTDPHKTWCYSEPNCVVRRVDCLPCYDKSQAILYNCSHRKCLKKLPVNMVIKVVEEIMTKKYHIG